MKILKRLVPAWVRELVYAEIASEIDRLPPDQVKRAVRRALGLSDLPAKATL